MGGSGRLVDRGKRLRAVNVTKRKYPKSRIIKSLIRDGRKYELHVTKGWRSYKETQC